MEAAAEDRGKGGCQLLQRIEAMVGWRVLLWIAARVGCQLLLRIEARVGCQPPAATLERDLRLQAL